MIVGDATHSARVRLDVDIYAVSIHSIEQNYNRTDLDH